MLNNQRSTTATQPPLLDSISPLPPPLDLPPLLVASRLSSNSGTPTNLSHSNNSNSKQQ
jgi:hypothetical protein